MYRSHDSNRLLAAALLVALTIVLALPAQPAYAAAITVDTLADENGTGTSCSLREAITAANTDAAFGGCTAGAAGSDTIQFSVSGTINLSVAELSITTPMIIDGPGASSLTIDAGGSFRVFNISSATGTFAVTIREVTITDGSISSGIGAGVLLDDVDGTLENVVVTANNTSSSADGAGVGCTEDNGTDTTLTIKSSTISNNTSADDGAGIHIMNQCTVSIADSTISGNSAVDHAGALNVTGNAASATHTITGSTFSGNTADSDSDGVGEGGGMRVAAAASQIINITNSTFSANATGNDSGGAIFMDTSTTNLYFVTVTNNTTGGSGDNAVQVDGGTLSMQNSIVDANVANNDCGGSITSAGGNVSGTGCPSGGSNDTTSASELAPLADNGGPAMTHRPCTGASVPHASCTGASPALERTASGTRGCATTISEDQRGSQRAGTGSPPDGGTACDSGAVEGDSSTTPTLISLQTFSSTTGKIQVLSLCSSSSCLVLA